MLVMTYSDARANLSDLLNHVKTDGAAIIRRADGSAFRITVEEPEQKSPFDGVKPLLGKMPLDEVLGYIREGRERG